MSPHLQNILEDVNREVKQTTKHYRLMEYQSKLDTSALEKSTSKLVSMFKVSSGGEWTVVLLCVGILHNVHSIGMCDHKTCVTHTEPLLSATVEYCLFYVDGIQLAILRCVHHSELPINCLDASCSNYLRLTYFHEMCVPSVFALNYTTYNVIRFSFQLNKKFCFTHVKVLKCAQQVSFWAESLLAPECMSR